MLQQRSQKIALAVSVVLSLIMIALIAASSDASAAGLGSDSQGQTRPCDPPDDSAQSSVGYTWLGNSQMKLKFCFAESRHGTADADVLAKVRRHRDGVKTVDRVRGDLKINGSQTPNAQAAFPNPKCGDGVDVRMRVKWSDPDGTVFRIERYSSVLTRFTC